VRGRRHTNSPRPDKSAPRPPLALNPLRASLIAMLGWLLFLFYPAVLFAVIEAMGKSLYVLFAIITIGVVLAFVSNLFGSLDRLRIL